MISHGCSLSLSHCVTQSDNFWGRLNHGHLFLKHRFCPQPSRRTATLTPSQFRGPDLTIAPSFGSGSPNAHGARGAAARQGDVGGAGPRTRFRLGSFSPRFSGCTCLISVPSKCWYGVISFLFCSSTRLKQWDFKAWNWFRVFRKG